jgi:hypothetical protein
MITIYPSQTFTKTEKMKDKSPTRYTISQQMRHWKQTYKSVKCNVLYKLQLSSSKEVYTLLSK